MGDFFDIIVVGAGPAGSAAAMAAARAGVSVLLLERKKIVGDPIRCGEVLGRKSLQLLVDEDERWIVNRIHSTCFISPGGHRVTINRIGTGLVLHRQKFDEAMAGLAQSAGAELRLQCRAVSLIREHGLIRGVQIRTADQGLVTIRCRVVIAADGVESRVARWAGIQSAVQIHDIESCLQYVVAGVDVDEDTLSFYMGADVAPEGYLWVFPRRNREANVGIGISGRCAGERGPQQYLDRFLRERFPDAVILRRDVGGVTVCPCLKRLCLDNFMVVGDAARQVNCLNGGGIIYGMNAGRIAGQVASDAVKRVNCTASVLSEYPRRWFRGLGRQQLKSYALKEAVLRVDDGIKDRIAEKLKDRSHLTYFDVFKGVFWTKPWLLFKLIRFFK